MKGLEAARDTKLLDFVGVSAGRSGVDGDLEVFTSGVEYADEVFLIGLRGFVSYLERTRSVAGKEGAKNLTCLGLGAVAGRRQNCEVQIICKPAGEGHHIPGCKVFGN